MQIQRHSPSCRRGAQLPPRRGAYRAAAASAGDQEVETVEENLGELPLKREAWVDDPLFTLGLEKLVGRAKPLLSAARPAHPRYKPKAGADEVPERPGNLDGPLA